MDDRHCPAGACGTKLFAEHAVLARCGCGMVQATRIEGDPVPMSYPTGLAR
jgi:hypothetical protein